MRTPLGRRLIVVPLGIVATIGVMVGGFYAAVDLWHLEDRIVSGGRIRHCWLLGGMQDVEMHLVVGLDPSLRLEDFGWIIEDGHEIVVARVVRRSDDSVVGYGAWSHGGESDPEGGAVNALARRVSSVDSKLDERHVRSQIRAARECSERDIPH